MHRRFPCLLVLFFASLAVSHAQRGLLVHKENPWQPDEFAIPTEYFRIEKFSTVHNATTRKGETVAVLSPLVLCDLPYISVSSVQQIGTEADLAPIRKAIASYAAAAKRFPKTSKLLQPRIAELKAEAAQFEGGKIKFDGVWMTRDALAKLKQD